MPLKREGLGGAFKGVGFNLEDGGAANAKIVAKCSWRITWTNLVFSRVESSGMVDVLEDYRVCGIGVRHDLMRRGSA